MKSHVHHQRVFVNRQIPPPCHIYTTHRLHPAKACAQCAAEKKQLEEKEHFHFEGRGSRSREKFPWRETCHQRSKTRRRRRRLSYGMLLGVFVVAQPNYTAQMQSPCLPSLPDSVLRLFSSSRWREGDSSSSTCFMGNTTGFWCATVTAASPCYRQGFFFFCLETPMMSTAFWHIHRLGRATCTEHVLPRHTAAGRRPWFVNAFVLFGEEGGYMLMRERVSGKVQRQSARAGMLSWCPSRLPSSEDPRRDRFLSMPRYPLKHKSVPFLVFSLLLLFFLSCSVVVEEVAAGCWLELG